MSILISQFIGVLFLNSPVLLSGVQSALHTHPPCGPPTLNRLRVAPLPLHVLCTSSLMTSDGPGWKFLGDLGVALQDRSDILCKNLLSRARAVACPAAPKAECGPGSERTSFGSREGKVEKWGPASRGCCFPGDPRGQGSRELGEAAPWLPVQRTLCWLSDPRRHLRWS